MAIRSTSDLVRGTGATPAAEVKLAVDIGGTFTDVVLETPSERFTCKVLTTEQPELGVMQGIARLFGDSGLNARDVTLLIHGTTLATNALIERKGARTALLSTAGYRDVVEMGFEKRFEQFDINIERPPELVPRPLRFTVDERIAANGDILLPLNEAQVEAVAHAMVAAGVEAVAIGFLHSYAHPGHERRARELMADLLGPAVTICISSEVCPEMREYERFSTTCANAYVQPLIQGYLDRLRLLLDESGFSCPLLLMTSGGGLTALEYATQFPIRLVESGPAGGAIFAAHVAGECRLGNVVAFDMGGTTAKICLIDDGVPERTRRFEVGRVYRNVKGSGLPLRIPVIELVEIGAGGGSIARVDALSRIVVGPDSAGANPGPACYGRGGTRPTVTDANLALGRIDARTFAAGQIPLDMDRAESALLDAVGTRLSLDAYWSAVGVSEIVEENMANAARVHAIERGKSITDYSMVAFGGAAPLHAGRLAQKLGIRRVVIPAGAGVGSAIGFARAPVAFEVVRGGLLRLGDCDPEIANSRLDAMRAEALRVVRPAAHGAGVSELRSVEMRYVGQGHELRVELPEKSIDHAVLGSLRARFETAYEKIYGLRIAALEVEIVTWTLTATVVSRAQPPIAWRGADGVAATRVERSGWEPALGESVIFSCHRRSQLGLSDVVRGPALINEAETTTVVPAGWTATLDPSGHLILEES
jgi:N-methylhydantoinase A